MNAFALGYVTHPLSCDWCVNERERVIGRESESESESESERERERQRERQREIERDRERKRRQTRCVREVNPIAVCQWSDMRSRCVREKREWRGGRDSSTEHRLSSDLHLGNTTRTRQSYTHPRTHTYQILIHSFRIFLASLWLWPCLS